MRRPISGNYSVDFGLKAQALSSFGPQFGNDGLHSLRIRGGGAKDRVHLRDPVHVQPVSMGQSHGRVVIDDAHSSYSAIPALAAAAAATYAMHGPRVTASRCPA